MVALVVAVFAALTASADTFRWNQQVSATVNPVVDWSAAAKWTNVTAKVGGVLPGTADDVVFPVVAGYNIEYEVTPPADFAGTIKGEKNSNFKYGMMARIEVTPAEGAAAYTLVGDCVFVANDSLAAHIGSTFKGCIEIPEGVSFTATANIPDAVDFMGPGDIALTKAVQLQHIAGVSGRIDARALGTLSASDMSLLEGHVVTLPGSVTLEIGRMLGVTEALDDWTVEGAWLSSHGSKGGSIGGGSYTPTGHGPQVCEDGSLLLTDDFDQLNICTMTNRCFVYDDVWQLKFTWQRSQPPESHYKSGGYTFWNGTGESFGGALLRNNPAALPSRSNAISTAPANSIGFRFYGYNGAAQGFGFNVLGNGSGATDEWTNLLPDSRSGIAQGGQVDVTVSYRKGYLYTTISQSGNSRSFRQSVADVVSGTNKCYYGIYAATTETLWQWNRITKFSGWRLTRNGGQWKEVSGDYSLNSANWNLTAYSGSVTDANKITGDALILANGAYKLLNGQANWNGRAVCKTPLPTNRRLRIDYDVVWGAQSERGGEGFHFGFVNSASPVFDSTINSFTDNANNNPANWTYDYWVNYMGFTGGNASPTASGSYGSDYSTNGPKGGNRTAKCSLFYDGTNTLYGIMRCNSVSAAYGCASRQFSAFATRYPSGMYMHFYGACATWACYIRTDIANFKVMEWDGEADGAATLITPVAVADGDSVAIATGDAAFAGGIALGTGSTLTVSPKDGAASVAIGKVQASGAATLSASSGAELACGAVALEGASPHGVTVTGDVSFGDSLAFVVPSGWDLKAANGMCLLDATSATGDIPGTLTIVSDNGTVLPSEYLRVAGGRVLLNTQRGSLIVVF